MGNINCWHTDFLSKMNHMLYKDVLMVEDIVTDEISKRFKDLDYFGFVISKDNNESKVKEKYFIPTDLVDKLPIIVKDKEKFSYKNEVYWFVKSAESVKIPSRQMMDFRDMVDEFANYKHSNPKHWTLAKIIMIAAYVERLNIRIVSEASFGKDGLTDIIMLLNGKVANLYKATLAKLKYSLMNDLIVINELGALKKEDIFDMQTYLLQAGSYKPKYENNSRSVVGTKETMDLTKKSHIIFHNTPEYYQDKGQVYFEKMFTPAVIDRFPAVLMEGYVTEDFSTPPEYKDITEEEVTKIKNIIATINFYKDNNVQTLLFEVKDDFFGFSGKQKQRSLRSFKIIMKYVSAYSKSKEEFLELMNLLKACYVNYKNYENKTNFQSGTLI